MDRSWTFRLLDELQRPDCPDASEVASCIAQLEDPRATPVLLGLLLDRTRPAALRELVSSIDGVVPPRADGESLEAWWAGADHWERRATLRACTRREGELVLSIARNPGHPLWIDALARMYDGFDEPRYQQQLVAALASDDAEACRIAALATLGCSPIAALHPLLDLTRDPRAEVAAAAIAALGFHGSRVAFARIAECRTHEQDAVRAAAIDAATNRQGWELSLRPPERARVAAWLGPELVRVIDERRPEEATRVASTTWCRPTSELRATVDDRTVEHVDAESLVQRVRDDPRDSVRIAAVESLARMGARERVSVLLGILSEPPALGWRLHVALIDAARALGLPLPDADALAELDDLDVQIALARHHYSSGARTSAS